ncbi:TAXI family TRAP transporter solute-binding subunit [Pseudanabaena sp. PCC 6802]|uniref:TAXI family TRAP transporter solute-binding subunit n=1 Tax=Pseudanabaena sp. PCC 6802 TaxID=118173 RepID=UPI0003494205|nr:TAXI family TRAP transporter solute-binding subunit [Pseudanabaena sp. PCC 6802]
MRRKLFLVVLAVITAFAIVVWKPFHSEPAIAKDTIRFLTARKDSLYYKAGKEFAETLKDAGFTFDIQESPGSFKNLKDLGRGRADLAFAQQDAFALLRNAGDPNISKLANNIKVFAPLTKEVVHIIANSASGINSLSDLAGKTVGVGPSNSGTYVSAVLLYQLHNLDVIREDLVTMEVKDAIEQVKNGKLDAAFYTAGVGAPLLKNIAAGAKLKLVSIDASSLVDSKGFLGDNPELFASEKIPANTYPWQKQAVNAMSTFSFIYANRSLDSQKVYNLAKAAYGKSAALKAKNSFWKLFSIDDARSTDFAKLDYHPGVKKLLQEK